MVEPRLKSKIRVAALLRQADAVGRPGVVLKRGDADAGAILIVLRAAQGLTLLSQTRDAHGDDAWVRLGPETPLDQETADQLIGRQMRFDADLWVVEFENMTGKLPFHIRVINH